MKSHLSAVIGLLGTYGNGNLGDEAIFEAAYRRIRELAPQIRCVALTVNPVYMQNTYGVIAYPIQKSYRDNQTPRTFSQETKQIPVTSLEKRSPAYGRVQRLATTGKTFVNRFLHWPTEWVLRQKYKDRIDKVVSELDAVIVLGGGQIFDSWGGPMGHTNTLYQWSQGCQRLGKPFSVISIGAIPLTYPHSRKLTFKMLSSAKHISFRDHESRQLILDLGLQGEFPILPDLAFSLPAFAAMPSALVRKPHLGLSPMAYMHPTFWPENDPLRYSAYLDLLARFAEKQLASGFDITLFATQVRSDFVSIADLKSRIKAPLGNSCGLLRVNSACVVTELMQCLSTFDAVVASRFHGVLLSLLAEKPVLSLAYQPKNDRLLASFSLNEFALRIDTCDPEKLQIGFSKLWDNRAKIGALLNFGLAERRARLDDQYRNVLSDWLSNLRYPSA